MFYLAQGEGTPERALVEQCILAAEDTKQVQVPAGYRAVHFRSFVNQFNK